MIASILSAFVSTTTIEWTDTPYTEDSILTWLAEHETVLVAEDEGDVVGVAAYGVVPRRRPCRKPPTDDRAQRDRIR